MKLMIHAVVRGRSLEFGYCRIDSKVFPLQYAACKGWHSGVDYTGSRYWRYRIGGWFIAYSGRRP